MVIYSWNRRGKKELEKANQGQKKKKEKKIKHQKGYRKTALKKSQNSLNMDLEFKQKIVLLKLKNRSRKILTAY